MCRLLLVAVFIFIPGILFAQTATLVSTSTVISAEIAPVTEYVGSVEYFSTSSVAAERAGRIDSFIAGEGKDVQKGNILVTLNSDTLRHNIAATKARLGQQRAMLDRNIRDYERAKIMFNQRTVSEQRYQDAGTELEIQQYMYDAAAAELSILEDDLAKSTVRAPFDGIVIRRYVNVGNWVNIGTTLYDIAMRRLEVVVNIPQAYIQTVTPGLEVNVKVNGKFYIGKVRAVIPQGNANLRTFPVKIDIDYNSKLFGGMDCSVFIPTGPPVQSMMVPRDAVVTRNNIPVVFTIKDGKAKSIPVSITGYSGINAGISSQFLTIGMNVITRGNELLNDGGTVTTGRQ